MQVSPVTPLLRKDQVEDMESERQAKQEQLRSPHFQGDKGEVFEQLRALEKQLESQRPRPYDSGEIDTAIRRERELREEIQVGMLSHEEMRKCPPGAVDRHREWEKRNIRKIEEWQNIQRRLTAETDERESASIERFRPKASVMNMDGALIPGKNFFLPPMNAGMPTTFSNEQLATIRALNPALADMLGTLNNAERARVKEIIDPARVKASEDGRRGVEKREAKKQKRHQMSEAARAAARERMKKMHADKAAAKQAAPAPDSQAI